ncbi:type I methionyl aminopeptidase [Candidatus Amesbacteria bacterium RIFCSPHIGHO2_02_FULL_47_9]|uniref:Methionine aminopeptidase n=1 Tax=Candidatus Amesbacteria bacterium RIFCSPHIGHO2_01_FULL_48_32b TaxID=1797253 RepID=A0A1F4YIT6_9BACT|nr:MAG: type I methionyl aminopeptidase [Candidatus Amesbacteria bacterium RIFCSPHIGHO2_01_FULL_48_32b]OGD04612.1 MAG: type I methionyl aminopeptidase [Candidatus Amesbacteria bacterium RIFCSPHIGHO2_02_FULL_47_9]OGD07570.1 MAG: type I methionyl aminopeptidase [Candidatus Amesbacteria bacterium RIFCSPLOWO2_01_FULL_49_25]
MTIKTAREIEIMREGGKMLAKIRDDAVRAVCPGMTTAQLDGIIDKAIERTGGMPSFKMVKGYHHATCINVNEVVVHGIPGSYKIKDGDKVGIDLGLFYKGFHTDTSVTVTVNSDRYDKFLQAGRDALQLAIAQAKGGKRIADISGAMQLAVERAGYSVVRALTGHGIGRELHEEPAVPCFVTGKYHHSPKIEAGMVLAIEVMYNEGGFEVAYKNDDGWTIVTTDGKISGLFEETVAVTRAGPVVLTKT